MVQRDSGLIPKPARPRGNWAKAPRTLRSVLPVSVFGMQGANTGEMRPGGACIPQRGTARPESQDFTPKPDRLVRFV